jgi:hypothetical protein
MSTFDWKATQFEERWFHALACVLARTNQQQEAYANAHAKEHLDEAEWDDTCDSETDVEDETENIAGSLGKKILKEKFLDRLAEVMAREMNPNKKRNDVFATGTLDFEHQTVIYLARNDGLLDTHKKMMRMIQIWLRAVASTGERRVISKDKMWSELVTWSLPRLEYYRDQLRSSFTIFQGPLLESISTVILSKLEALQICCTSTRRSAFVSLNFTSLSDSTNGFSYETFTEFAMQFTGAKSIEFCGVEAPVLQTLEAFESS